MGCLASIYVDVRWLGGGGRGGRWVKTVKILLDRKGRPAGALDGLLDHKTCSPPDNPQLTPITGNRRIGILSDSIMDDWANIVASREEWEMSCRVL